MLGVPIQLAVLDAVILGILVIGLVLGLLQGVLRQIFLLGAVYFGIVLAAQYYLVAASAMAFVVPGGETRAYSAVGLLIVFVVSTLSMNAVGYLVYSSTKLPLLAAADHLGGAVLGVLSAWLFVSLTLTAANFGLAIPLGGIEWAQRDATHLIGDSTLVPVVHDLLPAIYGTLRPWVPSGIPAPFVT